MEHSICLSPYSYLSVDAFISIIFTKAYITVDLDIYQRSSNETDGETEELPIGWSVKQDPRTRRKYYEK